MVFKDSALQYLAFAENQEDCCALERYVPKRRICKSDVLVVALGVETHKYLREHSWLFRPLEEIFDLSSYEQQLWNESTKLADTWFKTLPLDDYFFEQVAIPDFRRFFTHALACQIVLDNVLPRYSNRRIVLLPSTEMPLGVYSGYLHQMSRNAVFKGVLRWHCRRRSIPTVELGSWVTLVRVKCSLPLWITICLKMVKPLGGPSRIPMYLLNRLGHRMCKQRVENPAKWDCVGARSKSSQVDVMFANWDFDLKRNMRFRDVVYHHKLSQMEMVHVSSDKLLSSESVPTNHRITSSETHLSLRRYFGEFVIKVFLRRARVFRQFRHRLANKHNELFRNSALDFQFLHLFFDVYTLAYRERYHTEALLKRYAPRVYVTSDVDNVDKRAQLLIAKEWGAITMTTNHGFYLYAPPASNFEADYCLVGGTALKRNLVKGGVAEDRIAIIGNPSFQSTGYVAGMSREEKPRIVIVTSAPYDLWSFQYRLGTFLEYVRRVAERLSSNGDWHVIIKSHPLSDHYFCYDAIVQQYGRSNLQHISKSWRREEFQGATAAVCLGPLSGSMLELQYFKVPIVYLNAVIPKAPQFDYDGCGVVANTTEEVCEAVERLIGDEKYRQAVIQQGLTFLHRYTNFPDNSLDTFSQVLGQSLQNVATSSRLSSLAKNHEDRHISEVVTGNIFPA